MSDQRMDVFLLAAPQEGVERSALVKNLAKVFKKDFQSVEKMLRKSRTLIKSDVGHDVAAKYKAVIEKAGGQCEVVTQGQASAALLKSAARSSVATKPNATPKRPHLSPPVITAIKSEPMPNFDDVASYCVTCDTAIRLGQTKCARCSMAEYTPEKNTISLNTIFSVTGFIIIIGLMIVIAVPAYRDHTTRERVKASMPLVINAHKSVASFIKKTRSYPNENLLVGLPDKLNDPVIESIKLRDEAFLEVTYRFAHMKDQNTILWTPVDTNAGIAWSCKGGTMDDRYRQKECWMGNETTSSANDLTKNFLTKDKKMSIRVPASWKVKDLMPNAMLSFADEKEETYIAILADPKTDFTEETLLEDYVSVVQQQMVMNMSSPELVRGSRKITIKNLPAERFIFRGDVGGVKMAYVVTLFEKDEHFYRMLAWTPQARLDKNKALLENVSRSIRLQ